MSINMGGRIRQLRYAAGLTQEQLANALGISAPAVSKWETNTGCPDVALLCPLARALHTNVDTLLNFEEQLSDEQMTGKINAIVSTARTEGCACAQELLKELLHTYPSHMGLKYNASLVIDLFQMLSFPVDDAKKTLWDTWKKDLLTDIYASKDSVYFQHAVLGLASMAVGENALDEAEMYLKQLPEHNVDATMISTQLYIKREQPQKALEILQKRLYTLVRQVQNCLMLMMNEKIIPDSTKALEICDINCQLDALFGLGGMSVGFLAEVYERCGNTDALKKSMIQMLELMCRPLQKPKEVLFSPTISIADDQSVYTKEMKQIIVAAIENEPKYQGFLDDAAFAAAVERVKKNI